MGGKISAGDRMLLRSSDGHDYVVEARDETARVAGLGVLKLGELLGKPWGSKMRIGGEEFQALRPILTDHLALLDRGAQIVLPKDAARIVLECGLHDGSRLVEAGVGSGALTMALAHAVAPQGRVYAYDRREDHLKQGRRNVAAAGLEAVVEFRVGDVGEAIPESDLDAVVLDLPEPEQVVKNAWKALRPSGVFASYSPLVSQVERTVLALRECRFLDVRALELLERAWVIGERGSRPETNMLAHTGFLTFARRP